MLKNLIHFTTDYERINIVILLDIPNPAQQTWRLCDRYLPVYNTQHQQQQQQLQHYIFDP